MDDSWKQSLMTGDQCALCEEPLGEEPVELEEEGRLLMICGKCALERRRATSEQDHARPQATELLQAAQTRAAILDEILEYRQAEESQLQGLRDFIDKMADALSAGEAAAEDLRLRLRQSQADFAKLEDRVRRMESSARMQSVSAAPTPQSGEPAEPASVQGHSPPPTPELSLEPAEFAVEDLHLVQRLFNESEFTDKMRSIRRSLGSPVVHLAPVSGRRQVLMTVAWEIVWYQFLIELSEDAEQPVALFGEGMELEELGGRFGQGNAGLDDNGRLDASELEFELLEDPDSVISDTSPGQTALEDATEEVWDRQGSPEFRWED